MAVRLDHNAREVLLRFDGGRTNTPVPPSLLGDSSLSALAPALGTLVALDLVMEVTGGYALTQLGIEQLEALRSSGWH